MWWVTHRQHLAVARGGAMWTDVAPPPYTHILQSRIPPTHARTHARTSPSHRHRHRHHHRHRYKRHAARPIRGGIVSRPYATPSAADAASASMRRHPCVQCIAVPPHSRGVVDVDVDMWMWMRERSHVARQGASEASVSDRSTRRASKAWRSQPCGG